MDEKGRDADNPWRMPLAAWKAVAIRAWNESTDDDIGLVAAGVAFYGFLALAPMLAAIILSYGIFADVGTVVRHINALAQLLPPDIALTIGDQLLELVQASDGKKGLGVLFALAVALFGARNGAGGIISALNIAYEEKEKRSFVRVNLTALAITAAAVVGAILAAAAIAALGALRGRETVASDAMLFLGSALTYALLLGAGAAGAAALYRFGPSRHQARWLWLSPGSLFTALLWMGLSLGFGAYVTHIGKFDATYGSLGAVVALLTWLYLSAYVLLFGAELNSELEHQTAQDTTTGTARPLGSRRAWVADHVAEGVAEEAAQRFPIPAAPLALPAPVTIAPSGAEPGFIAARAGARIGRLAGLPKTGWIASGLASIGLAMLRKRGRKATGAALLVTAAGLSLLTSKE